MSVQNERKLSGAVFEGLEALTEFVVHVVVGTLMAVTLIATAVLLGMVAEFAHHVLDDPFVLSVFLWLERGVVLLDALMFGASVVYSTCRTIWYLGGK